MNAVLYRIFTWSFKLKVPYHEKHVFSGLCIYKPANSQNEENKRFLHGLCSPPTGKTALLQAVQIQLLSLGKEMTPLGEIYSRWRISVSCMFCSCCGCLRLICVCWQTPQHHHWVFFRSQDVECSSRVRWLPALCQDSGSQSSQPWSCSCFVLKCMCDIHLSGGFCGISGVAGVLVTFGAGLCYVQNPTGQGHLQRRVTDVIQMESILVAWWEGSVISRTIPQDHNKIAPVFCYRQPPPNAVYGGKGILDSAPRKLPDIIFMKGFKVVLIIRHR